MEISEFNTVNSIDHEIASLRNEIRMLRLDLLDAIQRREKALRAYAIKNRDTGIKAILPIIWQCFDISVRPFEPFPGSNIADCEYEATLIATLMGEPFRWTFNYEPKISKPLES